MDAQSTYLEKASCISHTTYDTHIINHRNAKAKNELEGLRDSTTYLTIKYIQESSAEKALSLPAAFFHSAISLPISKMEIYALSPISLALFAVWNWRRKTIRLLARTMKKRSIL